MAGNCSPAAVDDLMVHLELIIYIPIFLVGLVLNAAALMVFCVVLPKWTESTIYMTSLALMDFLLLFPLPFKMHASSYQWNIQLLPLCSLLEIFYFVGMYGSIYTIMVISLDRWVGICHPFRAKQLRSPAAAILTCAVVWIVVFSVISLNTKSLRGSEQGDFRCFHGFSEKFWSPGMIVPLLVFGFLVPGLVVVFCSVQSIGTLKRSGQHSSCVKFIYSSLGAFLGPFTPCNLGILLQFLVHQGVIDDCAAKTRISLFLQVSICLSNVTCCLDALCYYFITNEARSSKTFLTRSLFTQRRAPQKCETSSSKPNRKAPVSHVSAELTAVI
ncbi:G-protein coupled receptor 55 [Synchiropus splendidus]|uniref:G-protein coupled receptor 55 n=1 Tax=Synchiropus splendidus TaxID=270530 RepID=UPI00237E3FBC|nr:G-protein coupled receptor 55 [Synchiropus splendidus]